MFKSINRNKFLALTLLTALLFLAALSPSVMAQNQATVVVLDSIGGTVTPSGTTTYPAGQPVTLTATPTDEGFIFQEWIITAGTTTTTSADNPITITVEGGETYAVQAFFQPVVAPPGRLIPSDLGSAAIVVVLAAAGGTTIPAPGTYALANAEALMLTATPNSGWQFSHWTISGATIGDHGGAPVDLTPTDNPYNVNHGYGYTYNYQPVFTPVGGNGGPGGATPTPTPGGTIGGLTMETLIIIGLVVVIIVILVAFAAYAAKKR